MSFYAGCFACFGPKKTHDGMFLLHLQALCTHKSKYIAFPAMKPNTPCAALTDIYAVIQPALGPVLLPQALLWFKSPPRYFARCTRKAAAEQLAALQAFITQLASVVTFWSGGKKGGPKKYPSYSPSLPTAAHPVGPGNIQLAVLLGTLF